MSSAAAMIRELADDGIHLSRNGDKLRIEAPRGRLTPELKATLTEHKPELLAALSAEPVRIRLLRIVADTGLDPALVRNLDNANVFACAGLPDATLHDYVHALHETTERHAGRVPPNETATSICQHCGLVWIAPEVAAVVPVVKGWPRVLGCAWCHVRHKGRPVPRPPARIANAGK